jgi:hypothetical protein
MKKEQFIVALLWAFFWTGPLYGSGNYDAPPDIKASLPKFCWVQYFPNIPDDDPDYSIQGCGAGVNHYCPGLVKMAQAEREKVKSERVGYLSMAKADMQYTLNNTVDFPDCFLRTRAQANIMRINFQLDMLKYNVRQR